MNSERTVNIKTACENCEFCLLDDGAQTGCRIGRLPKYIEAGLAEQTGDFFTINTWCNTFRNKGYYIEHGGEQSALENLKDEIKIQADFVILAIDDDVTLQDIVTSFKLSHDQTLRPNKIVLVIKGAKFSYKVIQDALNQISDIPYVIVKAVDLQAELAECIDMGVRKCTSMYYTLWNAGYKIPIDYLAKLNCIMNEDMKQFSMVLCDQDYVNGLTVQTMLHKILSGNVNAWIGSKIQHLASEQNKQEMIVQYE